MKTLPKYLELDGITVEIANAKEYNRLRRHGYTVPKHDPEKPMKKAKSKATRPSEATAASNRKAKAETPEMVEKSEDEDPLATIRSKGEKALDKLRGGGK